MTEQFTIYHGACSPGDIRRANQIAPGIRHGHCWSPQKQTPHDNPWFLDNGVYSAWDNDRDWYPEPWAEALMNCREKMPRDPDFVVLPDALGDAEKTLARSRRLADNVFPDWTRAFAVQDGMSVTFALDAADELDCGYLFIGGTAEWKRRTAEDFIGPAHNAGLRVHIARPSLPGGIMWARDIGADSIDTTSIVRTPAWHHLERVANQQQFTDYEQHD